MTLGDGPFIYNFRSLSNKLPTIFLSLIFLHFPPQVMLFFVEKENPKRFSIQNCDGQRNQKILTFVKLYIESKIFPYPSISNKVETFYFYTANVTSFSA